MSRSPSLLSGRFLETTRGQVVTLLRREPRTVEDLATALGLSDNAIRSHLATLERDGLIRAAGVRRGTGAGKPANLYEIHPDAEPLFSRAYAPVLGALLDELSLRLDDAATAEIMKGVGRRLATSMRPPAGADRATRLRAAVAVLSAFGGDARVENGEGQDGAALIRGCGGCPLSSLTSGRPEVCHVVETLLSEVVGAPIKECCERGERPRCCFRVVEAA
jgi:predicted ArsR family transcriptional regulator